MIGAITETQKIIDDALKLEKKGEQMNMCKALEELEEKGREEGRQEGENKALILLVQKKIKKNKELSQIAEEAEEEESIIRPIYEMIKKYPEKTTEEIYNLLNK